jgi:hypothetical protein
LRYYHDNQNSNFLPGHNCERSVERIFGPLIAMGQKATPTPFGNELLFEQSRSDERKAMAKSRLRLAAPTTVNRTVPVRRPSSAAAVIAQLGRDPALGRFVAQLQA